MSIRLSRVRLAEADYPNSAFGLGKAQDMQPPVQVKKRDVARFSICLSDILKHQRGIEADERIGADLARRVR
jgi:hypothetical protein